jgi:hypothetical protein
LQGAASQAAEKVIYFVIPFTVSVHGERNDKKGGARFPQPVQPSRSSSKIDKALAAGVFGIELSLMLRNQTQQPSAPKDYLSSCHRAA